VARYDKYDPKDGGFRAPLNADLAATGAGNPVAVSLNTSGRVVVGGGSATNPIVGVLCTTKNMKAGDIVDVMTHGEIVEMVGSAAGGMVVAVGSTGVVSTAAAGAVATNSVRLGYTVEASRAVIRFNPTVTAV
jgi:hypothetical protein